MSSILVENKLTCAMQTRQTCNVSLRFGKLFIVVQFCAYFTCFCVRKILVISIKRRKIKSEPITKLNYNIDLFSRAWYRSPVFPRLVPVARFPALQTGRIFSRAWYWLPVFPRSTPLTSFPALGTGCTFLRTWYRFHVFPHLAPA